MGPKHFVAEVGGEAEIIGRTWRKKFEEELCVVVCGGEESAGGTITGGIGTAGVSRAFWLAGGVVTESGAFRRAFTPLEGAVSHAEGAKEVTLHVIIEVGGADFEASFVFVALSAVDAAGEVGKDGLKIEVAFAGVEEFFAGVEVDFQWISRAAPILKSAGMGEDVAGGDAVETWIVFNEAPGDVFGKRCVERECAFVAELENGVGENGFADGGGFENGVFIDGIFCTRGAEAEAARPIKRAVANERERSAGDALFVHD